MNETALQLPRAVRGRLHDLGQLGLFRARSRRPSCRRTNAAGVPRRRDLLSALGDDLRRGRVAASGTRWLRRARSVCVQRARQLHRRLGDRARLHDPAGCRGADGAELPGGVLVAAWTRRTPDRRRARGDRVRRVRQPDGHQGSAATAPDRDHDRRSRASGGDHHPRSGAGVSSRPAVGDGQSRDRADLVGPGVCVPDRRDRLHRPGGGREPGRRGQGECAPDEAACDSRLGGDRADLRGDRDRRNRCASGPPRSQRPRRQAHQRAGAGHRRVVQAGMGGRHTQVRGCDRGRARPRRGRRMVDARRLANRILARDQPPDPERDRAPQHTLGNAGRGDRRRRASRPGHWCCQPTSSC